MKISLFAIPVLALFGASFLAAQTKVGIINIQGAISSTRDGKKAGADLDTKFAPRRKEVEDAQNEIKNLRDQLQKGENTMSESSKQQIARDIDTKTKRLNRTMEDAQAELQQDEQKALQTIYQRMQVVLDKYAKDHGYSLILDVSSQQTPVLFASNGIDVTKDIIDLYDQNTGGAAPAAPAPAKP
ncbi:MAG TPA: OmpH family outer membrane protein [Bryobacteraceae bacterium]|nr:OmpH family outer membrane protein [Bryobacteraceae bacterium]